MNSNCFDYELVLIGFQTDYDDAGDPVKMETQKTVLASIRSATRNEFYNYGDAELRPEIVATVNACEYERETKAVFDGERYIITRNYYDPDDRDLVELTLSREIRR